MCKSNDQDLIAPRALFGSLKRNCLRCEVHMYGQHLFIAEYGSTGYGCQSYSWSTKQEKYFFSLYPFAPENLVSRDGFDRPVPRQPDHPPHSCWIWGFLTGFLPLSATASIYLYRQPPSSQSRVHQVTHLRTDGVHCREAAGAVPVVLKVVRVAGASFSGITMVQILCASLVPRPLLVQWTYAINKV